MKKPLPVYLAWIVAGFLAFCALAFLGWVAAAVLWSVYDALMH